MTHNWKPGDVAMVAYDGEPERVMMRASVEKAHDERACWLDQTYRIFVDQGRVQSERPLVVIDPADHKQIGRLRDLYEEQCRAYGDPIPTGDLDPLIDALREFAAPTPRIDEPTALYAVVRDADGREWCHIGGQVWRSLTSTGQFMVEKHWHDRSNPLEGNAVALLSEGVTA